MGALGNSSGEPKVEKCSAGKSASRHLKPRSRELAPGCERTLGKPGIGLFPLHYHAERRRSDFPISGMMRRRISACPIESEWPVIRTRYLLVAASRWEPISSPRALATSPLLFAPRHATKSQVVPSRLRRTLEPSCVSSRRGGKMASTREPACEITRTSGYFAYRCCWRLLRRFGTLFARTGGAADHQADARLRPDSDDRRRRAPREHTSKDLRYEDPILADTGPCEDPNRARRLLCLGSPHREPFRSILVSELRGEALGRSRMPGHGKARQEGLSVYPDRSSRRSALETTVGDLERRAALGAPGKGCPAGQRKRMTIQERIVAYLAEHSEGIDDDALASILGLKQRQQANQRCRRMEQFGIVERRAVNGKIRNFLNPAATLIRDGPPSGSAAEKPWYWEGNVQATVVHRLEGPGYKIQSVANTATREQGKDIIAIDTSGQMLWVSAKGYPQGTVKTSPRNQAPHWFARALFDLILWRGQDPSVSLGLAFPEQTTYRNLANRVRWFLDVVGASVFWVAEDQSVAVQEARKPGDSQKNTTP